jgi:ankyrin repeat protein
MSTYYDYSSEGEYYGDDDGVNPDSVLLGLVQSYDWAGTLARISAYPAECNAVGVQGRTPLHVACDHDAPAVVVEALLKAYPEASLMVGTSDMNPLHITCSSQHASVHVVRVLLEGGHDLQSIMRDVDGDTPLHAACRCGAPIEVLEVLLHANPLAVHERDYEGLTPLLRLWVRYFVILGDDAIEGVKGPADLTGELGEAWKKTVLLLRCAHLGSLETGTLEDADRFVFRAVHAASAVDCPRPVVKIATIVHPAQMQEKDANGMTPLLIAAQAPIFKVRDLSDEGYMLEDRIHGDDNNIHNETQNDDEQDSSQPSVIDILVQADTFSACIPDSQGRLPLHLAIASSKRWSEGVKAIIEAYPDALSRKDVPTNLHPFLQAAVGPRADPGTILELLRKDPSIVRDAISIIPHHQDQDDEPCHTAAKDQAHKALMGLGLDEEEKKETND